MGKSAFQAPGFFKGFPFGGLAFFFFQQGGISGAVWNFLHKETDFSPGSTCSSKEPAVTGPSGPAGHMICPSPHSWLAQVWAPDPPKAANQASVVKQASQTWFLIWGLPLILYEIATKSNGEPLPGSSAPFSPLWSFSSSVFPPASLPLFLLPSIMASLT